MASIPNQAPSVRSLRELLEERQEPFLIDVYLLEKGYSKKCHNSDTSKDCWFSSVLNKKKERFPKCSKLMKSVLAKVLFGKASKTPNCDRTACYEGRFSDFGFDFDMGRETQVAELHRFSSASMNRKMSSFDVRASDDGSCIISCNFSDMGRETQLAELERFSSASSTTIFESCSEDNPEEYPSPQHNHISSFDSFKALKLYSMKEQASADRRIQSIEDSKQFSPVSVLELPSDEGSPGYNQMHFFPRTRRRNQSISSFSLPKEVEIDSIISVSTWEFLVHSFIEKQELHGSCPSSQYLKSKRVLQQKRQLLLDCAREVVERHERKGTRWQALECVEPEKLETMVCDQIFSWEKQAGNVTNITQLLGCDFLESKQEWDYFQLHMTEIGIEIGDAIFEEIRNEIVVDMFDSIVAQRC